MVFVLQASSCKTNTTKNHLQELATVLMNYHIGRLVLSSLCVGAFGAGGFWWCSFVSDINISIFRSLRLC